MTKTKKSIMMISGPKEKIILSIALILIIVVVGILLHRAGQPYGKLLFTVHKISALILVYLIIKMAIPHVNHIALNALAISIALSSLSLVGLIASGGALSLNRHHAFMLSIHLFSTMIFLLSISGFFYTILQIKNIK